MDALSRNPVGSATNDDDFGEEIQDLANTQADLNKVEEELLCVQTGEETEMMGVRRKDRRFVQHDVCCFGINHWRSVGCHQLYMLDVASEEEPFEESVPDEGTRAVDNEPVLSEAAHMVKRRRPQYFDRRQQVELVLATQELSELGYHESNPSAFDDEEDHAVKSSRADIWEDSNCFDAVDGRCATRYSRLRKRQKDQEEGE